MQNGGPAGQLPPVAASASEPTPTVPQPAGLMAWPFTILHSPFRISAERAKILLFTVANRVSVSALS